MHIALHIYSKNLFINYALPDKKYKDKEQRERENISNRRSDLKISRMNINLSWHGIKFSSKRRRVANERWIQGGGRRRREYRRPGSQLSRANIGLAENYSDSWTALVESERIQNCKRQIFGFDEAEDIYIGHVLHRISPRHPPCIAGINPNTLPFATFPRQVTDALEVLDILSARHLYDPVKSSWNETETFFLSFFFYLSSRFTFISSCLFLSFSFFSI